MTDAPPRASSLSERLDRLPFPRRHLRVLTGSGIGWALDAMDVGLISFIIAALAVQWSLEPGQTAWIASIGFIGMAIGASLGGPLTPAVRGLDTDVHALSPIRTPVRSVLT